MSNNNYKPLLTPFARVFLIDGRARPDHAPEYYSSMKMGGLSQSFGDVTKVEIPDPAQYGKFVEVDRIRGATERATFNLVGRYAAAIKSRLITLARKTCEFDIQLHIGECSDPSLFNVFTKALIAEDAIITQHSTDDLGALESGENALVNETADISATEYYEVVPLSFATRAADLVTNHVNDVTIFDSASCGACSTESDGCQKAFAVTDAAGGSPGTSPDILFSPDKGVTWYANDVDTLTSTQDAVAVFGLGEYIVVLSTQAASESYAEIDDFEELTTDPVFTEVTTGFVGAPVHGCSFGQRAYIVGQQGYVYLMTDPAAGVTVLDAGAATTTTLRHVHAYDEEHAVAVGDGGAVIYTVDGESWTATTTNPVGIGVGLTWVHMRTATEWWVTANNGTVWYTLNSGAKWYQKTLPGTAATDANAVWFSTDSVGYIAAVVASHARLYQSFDGGYSWVVLPQGVGTLPLADELLSIAGCNEDPDLIITGGIADNSTDGIILVGSG